MNSDMRIVRGINIATLVFSIMGLLAGIAFTALMISASSMLSDPVFFDAFVQELQAGSSGSAAFDGSSAANAYDYSSMSDEQIREAASFGMNVVIALAVGSLLFSAVGIIASTMTLRSLAMPEKLRAAFGWTVAAAVCAAVIFSVITCVCFIVSAWLISRIRKNYIGYTQGFSYQGGMPGQQPGMYQGGFGQKNIPGPGNMPNQSGGFSQGGYAPHQQVQPQREALQEPQQPAQQPEQQDDLQKSGDSNQADKQ